MGGVPPRALADKAREHHRTHASLPASTTARAPPSDDAAIDDEEASGEETSGEQALEDEVAVHESSGEEAAPAVRQGFEMNNARARAILILN